MREITIKTFRRKCVCCGKKSFKISQNGLCVKCATEKVKLANLEMKHKEGPTYNKWKTKMMKSLGVEI